MMLSSVALVGLLVGLQRVGLLNMFCYGNLVNMAQAAPEAIDFGPVSGLFKYTGAYDGHFGTIYVLIETEAACQLEQQCACGGEMCVLRTAFEVDNRTTEMCNGQWGARYCVALPTDVLVQCDRIDVKLTCDVSCQVALLRVWINVPLLIVTLMGFCAFVWYFVVIASLMWRPPPWNECTMACCPHLAP